MSTSSATRTTPTATDGKEHQPWPPRTRWYASNAGQGTPGLSQPAWHRRCQLSKILIGKYQGTIYPEGSGYTGAIDLGYDGRGIRQRIKRKGRTKTAVKDKLIKLVQDRESGIQTTKETENYTVADAVRDWLSKGLKDRDDDTVRTNRILAEKSRTSSRPTACNESTRS